MIVDVSVIKKPRGEFQVVFRGLPSEVKYKVEGYQSKIVSALGEIKFIVVVVAKVKGIRGDLSQFNTEYAFYEP